MIRGQKQNQRPETESEGINRIRGQYQNQRLLTESEVINRIMGHFTESEVYLRPECMKSWPYCQEPLQPPWWEGSSARRRGRPRYSRLSWFPFWRSPPVSPPQFAENIIMYPWMLYQVWLRGFRVAKAILKKDLRKKRSNRTIFFLTIPNRTIFGEKNVHNRPIFEKNRTFCRKNHTNKYNFSFFYHDSVHFLNSVS